MHDPASTAAVGGLTLAAALTGGPLAVVFGEMALVMAIMGGLGAGVRYLALRRPPGAPRAHRLAEAFAMIAIGAGLAFGLGVLIPPILQSAFGLEIAPDQTSTPLLASCGFLAGLAQERVLARLGLEGSQTRDRGGDDA